MPDDCRADAVDWLTMPRPDPVPPPGVVVALTAAGFYTPGMAGAKRRAAVSVSDAAELEARRNYMQRARFRARVEAWLAAEERLAGERSWEAEIERREMGCMLPYLGPAEFVRRFEIARRRAAVYRRPRHVHDGEGWVS